MNFFFFPFLLAPSGNHPNELFESEEQKSNTDFVFVQQVWPWSCSSVCGILYLSTSWAHRHCIRSLRGNKWYCTSQKNTAIYLSPCKPNFNSNRLLMSLELLVPVCRRQLAPSSCWCLEKDVKVKFKALTPHSLAELHSSARREHEAGILGLLFSIRFFIKQNIMAQIKQLGKHMPAPSLHFWMVLRWGTTKFSGLLHLFSSVRSTELVLPSTTKSSQAAAIYTSVGFGLLRLH